MQFVRIDPPLTFCLPTGPQATRGWLTCHHIGSNTHTSRRAMRLTISGNGGIGCGALPRRTRKTAPHTYNMCYKEPRHYKHSAYHRPHRTPPPSDGETPIQTNHIPNPFRHITGHMQDRYVWELYRFLCSAQYAPHDVRLTVKPALEKPTSRPHATEGDALPHPVREGTKQQYQWILSTRWPGPAMLTEGGQER